MSEAFNNHLFHFSSLHTTTSANSCTCESHFLCFPLSACQMTRRAPNVEYTGPEIGQTCVRKVAFSTGEMKSALTFRIEVWREQAIGAIILVIEVRPNVIPCFLVLAGC